MRHKQPEELSTMVIDDERFTRHLVTNVLAAYGMVNIFAIDSAEEAVDHLYSSHFDLIICDIAMEKMDGLKFVETVRSGVIPFPERCATPIVLFSAHSDIRLVKAAMKLGANGYLVKPLVPARMLGLIANICHCEFPRLKR